MATRPIWAMPIIAAMTISGSGATPDWKKALISQFKVGDVVYLKEIEVRDDAIVIEILSREIVLIIERKSTVQMRYKGELSSTSRRVTSNPRHDEREDTMELISRLS